MTIPRIAGIFRLTRDPELRFTQSGKTVATLGLAASDSRKDESGNRQKIATLFIEANLWGTPAEIVKNSCSKGDELYVAGTPYTEQWQDKNGNKHSTIKLRAYAVKPIQKPQDNNQQSNDVWGSQPSQDFGSIDQPPF